MLPKERILVIAAHPDDEALGCIGTLYRHIEKGDSVSIMLMTDGVSSRGSVREKDYATRKDGFSKATKIFPYTKTRQLNFPDNAMDTVPFLDIAKKIESFIEEVSPTIVYTHYAEDLNIDHRLTYQAVMTACRPTPGQCVKAIFSFEVLSSTEWSASSKTFSPNYYVKIDDFLDKKMSYIDCYSHEMRPSPHSRSYENIKALALFRGSTVGVNAAEAFILNRMIDKD